MSDSIAGGTSQQRLSDAELSRFRKRRFSVNAGMLLVALPLAVMYLAPGWAQGQIWLFQSYGALTLLLLVAFLVGWRCPRCRVILFGQMNPRFCPRCGVPFTRDARS